MEVGSNKYYQYRHHDILWTLRPFIPLGDPKDM